MKRERIYSETVRNATRLLGAQVRQGRLEREWTVVHLAERAGISKNTVVKVEHGDPSVAMGTAFDLAVIVGVPLFYEDRTRLAFEAGRAEDRAALLGSRVRTGDQQEPDYEF